MIKRHYFLYFEVIENNQTVHKHFGEFYIKSWFSKNPADIMTDKIEAVLTKISISYESIMVVSFNRV